MTLEWIASAAFGLEGLVKRDLARIESISEISPLSTGGVQFRGDWAAGFRANLWLRTADRVLLVMKRFAARSFEELFQGVSAIPWEERIPKGCSFPVRAQCARSTLMSPSDCQSIVKKAVAERLKKAYGGSWLDEDGAEHMIDVSIREDEATISLDTSGVALNRRGYRTWNGEAPLRETLAASIVLMSPWHPSMPLHDPCCGTGTILIEAAFIAADRAPGLMRSFAMENWPVVPKGGIADAREEAKERYEKGKARPIAIFGSDIDPNAIDLARKHLKQAALTDAVVLETRDLRDVVQGGGGVFLANPPYGDRMGDKRSAQAVAKQLGLLFDRCPDWSMGVITADRLFEKSFGRRADRRRRLYNGRLECEFMTFLGAQKGGYR
jgi:putative N6-adenine-specific DNA methylase